MSYRLLLIDSNAARCQMLRDMLQPTFAVTAVPTVADAYEILCSQHGALPHGVVLDVSATSSMRFLCALKQDPPFAGIPVCAITLRSLMRDRDEAARERAAFSQAGTLGFLVYPGLPHQQIVPYLRLFVRSGHLIQARPTPSVDPDLLTEREQAMIAQCRQ